MVTVTIMIKTSKQPFKWDCRDDWISLMAYCGSIHQIFRDCLSISEPLIHSSESDWMITQIHIGYDISQQSSLEKSNRHFRYIKV